MKNKSQLGWHFGRLLGPTWLPKWRQVGGQFEAKLVPKSTKIEDQEEVKKMIEKRKPEEFQVSPSKPG